MNKKRPTIHEKLIKRKIKKPPAIIYLILAGIWKRLFLKKLGVSFKYNIDIKSYKGPYIVVSNHASRLDYIYTGIAFLPHRLNFVAGYNEFFRSHLAFIFRLLQVIPKKNFVSDTYTIKELKRIIESGGRAIIFPEGMSSISGSNQPCALGSGKLLKYLKVPVLYTKISGGYLTSTKYCLDERPGRVEVTVGELFTPERLESITADEIQDELNAALYNDDYQWNKSARASFAGNGEMAKNLHTLLFWCPRCGEELAMRGEGNEIKCSGCGNGAVLNEYYELIPLDDKCVIPETPRVWFDMERENIRRLVQEEGFELREKVELGILPEYKYLKDQKTSEIAGEGEIILNHNGFRYAGTKDGRPFEIYIKPRRLPTFGMCTDVSRFYTFWQGEFYEFYPHRPVVEKWFMAVEENHRHMGGKWLDFRQQAVI